MEKHLQFPKSKEQADEELHSTLDVAFESQLFEGDRSAKAIKKFLRKNAHNPLPESKKKAEKEAKKGEL